MYGTGAFRRKPRKLPTDATELLERVRAAGASVTVHTRTDLDGCYYVSVIATNSGRALSSHAGPWRDADVALNEAAASLYALVMFEMGSGR